MTVKDLIELLMSLDQDKPILFANVWPDGVDELETPFIELSKDKYLLYANE